MNNWYGWVEIGKRLCKVQCLLDSNHVGLDNRQNRDRVDLEVNGYQSGEVGKIVLIVKQSGISRDDPVAIGKKKSKKKYSLTHTITRLLPDQLDCYQTFTRSIPDHYPTT